MSTTRTTTTRPTSRHEWIERAKTKLDEWDQAIDQLEARATQKKLEAKSGVRAQINSIRRSLEDARAGWAKVRDEANGVWDAVSEEIGAAWEVNKAAFDKSLDELRSALR